VVISCGCCIEALLDRVGILLVGGRSVGENLVSWKSVRILLVIQILLGIRPVSSLRFAYFLWLYRVLTYNAGKRSTTGGV